MKRAVARSALFGAVGAAWLAVGDVGSSWAWVGGHLERLELSARLLGSLVPLGALLGALFGAYVQATHGPVRRLAARLAARSGAVPAARWEARLDPAPVLLLASPVLLAVAWLLFTGARASTLPLRPLWVLGATLVLHVGAYLALRFGRAALVAATSSTRRRASAIALVLVSAHVATSLVDRTVLPGLYPYVHGLLVAFSWLAASLACAVLWLSSPAARKLEHRLAARSPLALASLAAALLGAATVAVLALPSSQVVRVAMLSPRAPAARSLMLLVAPLLPRPPSHVDPLARERARRARDARRSRSVNGPVLEDAHVLLITIDALRADHLGAYGYRARPLSPTLDELAASSVVFEQAFAQAPHSSYSISSLMTSDYVQQRSELGLSLPTETLATAFRSAGYHAAAFYTAGIFHTDGAQLARYRDTHFGFGRVSNRHVEAEPLTDEVLSEISAIVEAGEPPSFVWAHYFDVHEPYRDTSFGTRDIDRYDGEIRNVDRALARLFRTARSLLRRPLIVVITADHGEEFGDHGGVYHGSTLYQEQIRVPLIVHVPGVAPRRVASPVELVDVAPTLLGLVGEEAPGSMRGDDLRPLIAGENLDLGPAFASVNASHMAVAWPHKLVVDLRYGTLQLFDLVRDPQERRSMADEHRDVVERLQAELHAWIDSLMHDEEPHVVALRRGRLADRAAAPALAALVADEGAEPAMRVEAARLLSTIPYTDVLTSLRAATRSAHRDVALEAAITLAWRGASGPREPLREIVEGDRDEVRRARAAIGLARVGDASGVPVLVQVVGDETAPLELRYEAIRLLGLLRDARGVEPLLGVLEDERLRRRVLIALGRTRDRRALHPLRQALVDPRHTALRDTAARALGDLGDVEAIPLLLRAMAREPLPSAAESLIRLGAVGRSIGGLDLAPGVQGQGVSECRSLVRGPSDEAYLDRTQCEVRGTALLPIAVPEPLRHAPSVIALVRARRVDAAEPVVLRVRAGETVDRVVIENAWDEDRVVLPVAELNGELTLELEDPAARVALDHVLLLPDG
jgi:arylsulfatase A-like enzyme